MPTRKPPRRPATPRPPARPPTTARLASALAWLEAHATRATLEGMRRYGIPSDHALGVAMKDIKALGQQLGRDHALARALWATGGYEARLLTAFVAEPAALTAAQMDRWCRDIDNWAHADTLCFHLFDRTPHAWAKVTAWSRAPGEFQRRTAFALLWALALHDHEATDAQLVASLALIERAADDDRHYVQKAVSMALRALGRRRAVRAPVLALATRLAASATPSARATGKETVRELAKRATATPRAGVSPGRSRD